MRTLPGELGSNPSREVPPKTGGVNGDDGAAASSTPGPEGGRVADSFLAMVYDELRRLAAHRLAQVAPGQTLQATALVHEAWLRLSGGEGRRFNDRRHFYRAAAEAMRRILIDRARRRQTLRHGGEYDRVEWDEARLEAPDPADRLLAVNDALERLAREHPVQAQVVQLRYFGGMTNEETAQVLELSVSTVKNYWVFSRAWLFREISEP